ncbi:MAG: hypothetical protein IJI57_10745 [Flexilinea sp.]|nr:hypothetical protein [Flexilinea sp.]
MKKKLIAVVFLILCLYFSSAKAEDEKKGLWESIGSWVGQAAEDTSAWVSQAGEDVSSWASQAGEDVSAWAIQAGSDVSVWTSQAWNDTSAWTTQAGNDIAVWAAQAGVDISAWSSQAWKDISAWTAQAWVDPSKWVSQAWRDSSAWTSTNWDNFILWVNTIAAGKPYSWITDTILDNGILAYENYADVRTFLESNPNIEQICGKYDEQLSELSLLNEDKEILWDMLQQWSNEQYLPLLKTSKLALPFLTRLLVEGEATIGDDAEFSGPVVGQYLLTVLESMDLKSSDKADMHLRMLYSSLEGLTRPVIIGDVDQNTLVTEDHYYIENFTFANGKYQIVMIVSQVDDSSQYPKLRGETLSQVTKKYFSDADISKDVDIKNINNNQAHSLSFTDSISDNVVTGKAVAVWTEKDIYQFFILTDQAWSEEEYNAWIDSITINAVDSITFEVDMESDGSFYGINQSAQKYTINRIFDEGKFLVPKTGHGWSAERGNNLIDNIKGFIQGHHSIVKGDDNVRDGADRVTTFADGSKLFIQTKYYNTAARSIAACFREGKFRYLDADGKPMAIEVPADQYEAAVSYMENRIANGQVPGVDDPSEAINIVKKGNLTYQQAKHIAKAGTVESILYDAAHACVTAGTSMGISAATNFAVNLWNGESFETAIKESLYQGLQAGGTSFIISVLSSQAAKTGLNTAMIPASKVIVHALGPKASAVIVNAFRPAGSAIYGAAAMQSAAKLLRGNVITSSVTFVVLEAGDVADIIQGRISWKQLAKNASTTAVGITGGALGYLGGAAIGTAILPGAGTVVGIIVSAAAGWGANEGAKAVADLIAEDDAIEMIRIIETQFSIIAEEYFLDQDEVDQSVENLQTILTAEMLKQMYQFRDHEAFARQLIEMSIDPVVSQRDYVELPSEEEYSAYLTEVLEEIYEDLEYAVVTD